MTTIEQVSDWVCIAGPRITLNALVNAVEEAGHTQIPAIAAAAQSTRRSRMLEMPQIVYQVGACIGSLLNN